MVNHTSEAHRTERAELAAAFRWAERLGFDEAVANHFSLVVDGPGTQFLLNPKFRHFSRIRASDLLLLDAENADFGPGSDASDPTAWCLHGALHRHCPHARCIMHVHSVYSTVLASLADSALPPIDQNCATFFNRVIIDENFGGLALEEEAERCARLFSDPAVKVMMMGNHGVLVVGDSVADTFNRLYYFERAAQTYILALHTGKPLRIMSDSVAETTAQQLENYEGQADSFLSEIRAVLDAEGSDYAS